MPSARSSRPASAAWIGLLVAVAGTSACGPTPPDAVPTVPSVDFTPKVVIEVGDTGIRATRGPKDDPAVQIDPLSVPQGTLAEVVNTGSTDRRLRSGDLVDTGTMRPGERIPIVLTKTTTEDTTHELVDATEPEHRLPLVLRPRPTGET